MLAGWMRETVSDLKKIGVKPSNMRRFFAVAKLYRETFASCKDLPANFGELWNSKQYDIFLCLSTEKCDEIVALAKKELIKDGLPKKMYEITNLYFGLENGNQMDPVQLSLFLKMDRNEIIRLKTNAICTLFDVLPPLFGEKVELDRRTFKEKTWLERTENKIYEPDPAIGFVQVIE